MDETIQTQIPRGDEIFTTIPALEPCDERVRQLSDVNQVEDAKISGARDAKGKKKRD